MQNSTVQTDTPILSLSEIQTRLKDKRLYVVSKESGLSYPTLKSLADGESKNPTLTTIKAVSAYLLKEDAGK